MIDLINPCTSCNQSWSSGINNGCESYCKAWLVYKSAKQREDELKDLFDQKINNLNGLCVNTYLDEAEHDEKVLDGIRYAFIFIRRELGKKCR